MYWMRFVSVICRVFRRREGWGSRELHSDWESMFNKSRQPMPRGEWRFSQTIALCLTVSHCVPLCPTVSHCAPLCRSLGENVAGIAHAHARVRYTHLHRFAVQTIQSRYNLALVNHSYKTITKYELNKINYLIKTYIVSFCLKISEL